MIITREQSLSLARKSGVVDKSSSNLNRFAQAAADLRNIEIEQLQAKNAELTAEVELLREDKRSLYQNYEQQRQQLAIAEAQNVSLREALRNLDDYCDPANHTSFCECDPTVGYQCAVCHWPLIQEVAEAREALSLPASREALDAYVAEKVKEIELSRDAIKSEWGKAYEIGALANHRLSELLSVLHRDGGHHEAKVGTAQAVEDAMQVFYKLTRQRDLAVSAIENLVKQKGRYNTEIAYKNLVETLSAIKGSET